MSLLQAEFSDAQVSSHAQFCSVSVAAAQAVVSLVQAFSVHVFSVSDAPAKDEFDIFGFDDGL